MVYPLSQFKVKIKRIGGGPCAITDLMKLFSIIFKGGRRRLWGNFWHETLVHCIALGYTSSLYCYIQWLIQIFIFGQILCFQKTSLNIVISEINVGGRNFSTLSHSNHLYLALCCNHFARPQCHMFHMCHWHPPAICMIFTWQKAKQNQVNRQTNIRQRARQSKKHICK